jgi:hypothetical protein
MLKQVVHMLLGTQPKTFYSEGVQELFYKNGLSSSKAGRLYWKMMHLRVMQCCCVDFKKYTVGTLQLTYIAETVHKGHEVI